MQNQVINGLRSTSCPGAGGRNGRSNHHHKLETENAKPERPSPIEPLIKPKVLIVHNAPLTRFGLTRLIEPSGRFEVCAETDDAPTARELFVQHQPQIVVLGLTLRGGDGIELIKDFRKLNPAVRTVVLSAREDALAMQRAFRAGARGYLVTGDDIPEILIALDQILAGDLYASPRVWRRLLENLANGAIESVTSELKHLSDRELQVFSLIGRGFGASRLANELHLSVKTIETHQTHIKEKLGLRSAAELSEKATRWMVHSVRRNLQFKKQASFKNGHTSPNPLVCSC
ncbi:MAG TPA: DNA-binding response regulator [Blastocatellia bacterium]|nr:DNA-binding response regulator [Blastocatellia bacterium]